MGTNQKNINIENFFLFEYRRVNCSILHHRIGPQDLESNFWLLLRIRGRGWPGQPTRICEASCALAVELIKNKN